MIADVTKQQLISTVVNNIKKHKGVLAYADIVKVLEGNSGLSPFEEAAFCIEASVICHNIPLWENNQPVERIPKLCFIGVITFTNSYKDEKELIEKSSEGFGTNTTYTNFKMPRLVYGEDTHEYLHPGSGSSIPDFVGSDGKTYEAKYDYQKGSPSSLHNADFLINCVNPGIAIYPIPKYGNVNIHQFPLARYTSVLSRRLDKTKLTCGEDFLELINSGELIYEIEKLL
jgi:hypothetical protein